MLIYTSGGVPHSYEPPDKDAELSTLRQRVAELERSITEVQAHAEGCRKDALKSLQGKATAENQLAQAKEYLKAMERQHDLWREEAYRENADLKRQLADRPLDTQRLDLIEMCAKHVKTQLNGLRVINLGHWAVDAGGLRAAVDAARAGEERNA